MWRLLEWLHRKCLRTAAWAFATVIVVSVMGAILAPISWHYAEADVVDQAELSLAMMNATRDYTSEGVRPALSEELIASQEFIPETVPAYSAREVFERLRQNPAYESFFYIEATLDPTNPRDRADNFETDLIAAFRGDDNLKKLTGYRERGGENTLYISQPLAVSRDSCLQCHGRPEDAPSSLLRTYGRDRGFNWEVGEITTAQTIYVPAANVFEESNRFLIFVMGVVSAICISASMALDRLFRQNRQIKQTEDQLAEENTKLDLTIQELEETRQSQSEIIHAEKMSSLSQIVAGFSHEINNPLSFIQGNIPPLREGVSDILTALELYQQDPRPSDLEERLEELDLPFLQEDIPHLLTSMASGSARIKSLVSALRKFTRMDEMGWKLVNLHEEIDRIMLLLASRFEATAELPEISLERHYTALPLVHCEPGQLSQALSHLLLNAIDAVRASDRDRPQISIATSYHQTERRILIEVTDNGVGIPDSIQPKIFDPFFTTKAVGSGTGLGLSIVYQTIVELHNGTVACHSVEGWGTKFSLEIPRRADSVSSESTTP